VSTDDQRLARVALSLLVEPGSRMMGALVDRAGPGEVLAALVDGHAPAALAAQCAPRMRTDPLARAADALQLGARMGARVLVPGDEEWPAGLDDLRRISRADGERVERDTWPPLCLWVRGPLGLAAACERAVAVVGARAATPYGGHVATEFGHRLADRGWTVVSGAAYGVDAAAHRGALAAPGATVAVLACGVDRAYPAGNAALLERIAEEGLLVSEWPPGSEPHRHRFLIRNRVIAALAAGTVMVEAAARSGARQTLGQAMRLGRAGMVVPGPVTSAMSVGCHVAARQWDARLVCSPEEVLEEVGRIGEDLAAVPQAQPTRLDRLDATSRQVLDAISARTPRPVEEVAAVAGVALRPALAALGVLEEAGLVVRRPGGYQLGPRPRRDRAPARAALPRGDARPPGAVT
jgi:DNA processing protein